MLRALATAFGFLTRLPVGHTTEQSQLGRALAWFPAVGAALGMTLVGLERLLRGHLAPELVAVLLVTTLALLSGGLHLDGVADVFDALGGGRGDRDRMLAIMRDSRIGAHGATALVITIAAKVFAIIWLLHHRQIWSLYAAPVAARWAVVPVVVFFRYARPEGLGRAFNGHGRPVHVLGATCVAALSIGWLGPRAAVAAAAALVTATGTGLWLSRHLGGLTGDVYGAAIELAELTFFIVAGT